MVTLGCSKNVYDSEVLMGQLKAGGKEVVHEKEGNIVVINTCGFINNAKEESINGKYIFVLPNDTLYKRVDKPLPVTDMLSSTGFLSIRFSGNMAVIKTRPGYASSIAFNIDDANLPDILGTVAGADTILMVIKAGKMPEEIIHQLQNVDPSIR